jgi:uncharacterized protein YkvS
MAVRCFFFLEKPILKMQDRTLLSVAAAGQIFLFKLSKVND